MFRINIRIEDEGMALLSQLSNTNRNKESEVSPLSPVSPKKR